MKCLLQLEEPRSGQTHHLTPLIDEMDLVDARGRDDHDVPIVLSPSGVEPPVRPVLAACMITILPAAMHAFRTRHCSTKDPGRITANAGPSPKRKPSRNRRVL